MSWSFSGDGINQSLLTRFRKCEREAKLFTLGWQSLEQKAALTFGDLGHMVLYCVYTWYKEHGTWPGTSRINGYVQTQAAGKRADDGKRWNEKEIQNFELWSAQMEVLINAYVEWHGKKDGKYKWLGFEQDFEVPFEQTKLVGTRDGMLEISRRPWLFETKFLGRIETAFDTLLTRDIQVCMYLLVYELETGKLPAGCIYNLVRRPGIKLNRGENIKQHQRRLAEHIASDPSHYFKRFHVPWSREQANEFKTELVGLVGDVQFLSLLDLGELPKYGQQCMGRYGPCEMIPICYDDDYTLFRQREFRAYTKKKGREDASKESKPATAKRKRVRRITSK